MRGWLTVFLLSWVLSARAELPLPEAVSPSNAVPFRLVVPEPPRPPGSTNEAPAEAVRPAAPPRRETVRAVVAQVRLTPQSPPVESLIYTNGDSFVGQFQRLDSGVISWKLAATSQPVRFRTQGAEQLLLGPRLQEQTPPAQGWLLWLADGSLLRVQSATFAGDHLRAELPGLGPVPIDRRQIRALRRVAPGLNELVSLDDAPEYGVADATAGGGVRYRYRPVGLPGNLLLEFPWPADEYIGTRLRLFSGEPTQWQQGSLGLDLQVSMRGHRLIFSEETGPVVVSFGGVQTNAVGSGRWVSLAYQRGSGSARLHINDQSQGGGILTLRADLPPRGVAVMVRGNEPVSPRAVIVSPCSEMAEPPPLGVQQDTLLLANHDSLVGKWELLTSNQVVFAGVFGRIELPLDRINRISLPNAPAPADWQDIPLLALAGGESLRARVQSVDGEQVQLQSPVLGVLRLPRTRLVAVGFQVQRPAPNWGGLDQEQAVMRRAWALRAQRLGAGARLRLGRAEPGSLILTNGTQYHGDLVSLGAQWMQWQHPAALDLLPFPVDQLRQIRPLHRSWRPAVLGATTAVRLRNGDVLTGVLTAGEGEWLRLSTPYAAGLPIPPAAVLGSNELRVAGQLLAAGPAADWVAEADHPLGLYQGVLWLELATAQSPRRLRLPDRLRVDLEATWSPERPAINLRLFAEPETEQGRAGGYYNVHLLNDGVQFGAYQAAVGNGRVNQQVASALLARLDQRAQAWITVLADRPTGQIEVYVDGHPAAKWQAPKGVVPNGHELALSTSRTGDVALRQFRVSEWSQPMPAPGAALAPVPDLPADPGLVRLVLHNGDRLRLADLQWQGETLRGRSPLLGELNLPVGAVRSLHWPPAPPAAGR